MLKIINLSIFLLYWTQVNGQAGEWTWMNGDSAEYPIAHYGTQGVFDSLNTPPALYESCEWTDLQGNFWLFGGFPYDSSALEQGDLWEYKPSLNQWAWIKGPGIPEQPGIYGTKGIPSPTNNPGARSWGCVTWTDLNNNLWLFGGLAFDANGVQNEMNDLWKYDITNNEWTWMSGADTIFSPGIYGIKGISSSANTPPCMWENNGSWTDSNNNLWLFGGQSYAHQNDALNTLWKYDISTNEWTWINGIDTGFTQPVYGTMGVASPINNPGGRTVYCKWKDSNDNLWFFGGGYQNHTKNDLWKYSIAADEWTWVGGDSSTLGEVELYSLNCNPSAENIPEGRYENRACWTRQNDNFAMYGGYGTSGSHNDLWNYNISTNEWTLMSGDTILNLPAVFGIKTVSNPNNRPAASGGAIGWKDVNNNLWLFGGYVAGTATNALWRYVPDTACPSLINTIDDFDFTQMKNSLKAYPNPFNSSFTISINLLGSTKLEILVSSLLGEEIYISKEESEGGDFSKEINLNQASNGVYFLQIKTSEYRFIKTIFLDKN
jgi:hypothetical protein